MTTIIDPLILTAWFAGIGIALMSAPLGCFIAWQRLVYFGDTVAHAALLGVVLALVMGASPIAGIITVAFIIALIVASLADDFLLPADTLLGIAAHGSLALALVVLSQSPSISLDVSGLLFGDILAVSHNDLIVIFTTAIAVLAILISRWKPLMRFVLHADIAEVEGINTRNMRRLLMLMIALVVGISIKLVGILLITSLLILPAACARLLAKSPSHMAICATFISTIAVTLGLAASVHYDTPSGPTIILAALLMLAGISAIRAQRKI